MVDTNGSNWLRVASGPIRDAVDANASIPIKRVWKLHRVHSTVYNDKYFSLKKQIPQHFRHAYSYAERGCGRWYSLQP